MPVRILPLEEADIPAKCRLELEVFRHHPRIPMQWPRGYTPDLYAFKESEDGEGFPDPSNAFFKAIDGGTGELLATAEWSFCLDPKEGEREGVTEETPPPSDWPEGGNWPLKRFYKINFQRMKREYLGKEPYLMLNFLCVMPHAQGKGIGKELLAWGLREADERHIRMCLESTPAGLALYRGAGFEVAEVIAADMRDFGWTQPYDEKAAERIFMIREAR